MVPVAAGAVRPRGGALFPAANRAFAARRSAASRGGARPPPRPAALWTRERADGRAAGNGARRGVRQVAHRGGPRARAAGRGRAGRCLRPCRADRTARHQGPAPHHPRDGDGEAGGARLAVAGAHSCTGGDQRAEARRCRARQGAALAPARPGAAGRLRFRAGGLVSGAGCRGIRTGRGRDRRQPRRAAAVATARRRRRPRAPGHRPACAPGAAG